MVVECRGEVEHLKEWEEKGEESAHVIQLKGSKQLLDGVCR